MSEVLQLNSSGCLVGCHSGVTFAGCPRRSLQRGSESGGTILRLDALVAP